MNKKIVKPDFTPFFDIPEDDSYEWLDIDVTPQYIDSLSNPFDLDTDIDIMTSFCNLCIDSNYLPMVCKYILNIEIHPFQALILEQFWTTRFPMLIASRGAGKSFLLAVYALLRLVLNPGCKVVLVGAAFRQSRQIFDYMIKFWDDSPILRDIAGGADKRTGPKREVDRCEFRLAGGVCYAIPLGTGEKIRGLRANYILADETASIPQNIFDVVVRGFGASAFEPIQKIKMAARINKLKEQGLWTPEMTKLSSGSLSGNQIVYSGTAYYSFNHFYKLFQQWKSIVSSKGDYDKIRNVFEDGNVPEGFSWKDYSVIRIPYTHVPEGLLDSQIVAQGKASMHRSEFLMEYGAVFPSDSDGFFKRSVIESATTNRPISIAGNKKVQFSALRQGKEDRAYYMGIDPAADKDNAAIVVVESHNDHRRIVHCWTTNKKKYDALRKHMKSSGIKLEDDYYLYVAKQIRKIMSSFNIVRILMDKNGGGTAISEALGSVNSCTNGELPVFTVIDPDDPKMSDIEDGIHILELVKPTSELNSEYNHGMLKDLQDKQLIFPMFDVVEMAKAQQIDELNEIVYDTYEDLVLEIEELKNEICTVECRPSSILGREVFDTPEIKLPNQKKGRLRKDRYSALLYVNGYCRDIGKDEIPKIKYIPVGGTKDIVTKKSSENKTSSLYSGPGMLKISQGSDWILGNVPKKRN